MSRKPFIKIAYKPLTTLLLGLSIPVTCFGQDLAVSTPQVKPEAVGNNAAASTVGSVETNPIITAMEQELQRSFAKLKTTGAAPVYYLAYRVYEGKWETIEATDGALRQETPGAPWRMLSVDLRVGSPAFDNTHYMRDAGPSVQAEYDNSANSYSVLPAEGAGIGLKQSLWLTTDSAFKHAQRRYASLTTSKGLVTAEDDKSGDFITEPAQVYFGTIKPPEFDRELWRERVRRLSKRFLNYEHLEDTKVEFSASPQTRYFVNTEGSKQIEQHLKYRVSISGSAKADDGMVLNLYDYEETRSAEDLPDEAALAKMVDKLAKNLEQYRQASVAEPFVGPAILSGKAAAVFFHETFGHRIEAQHQKNEYEGKTFAKRVGSQVMPSFLTVIDDPTKTNAYGHELSGHYVYDDEGVRAQPVTLAKNGVLTGFLIGRTPLNEFKNSNGHGRSSAGWIPAARQGVLQVFAAPRATVPSQELRSMLIREAKRQHKSYGLYFDDIYGGSTTVSGSSSQTFSVYPLRIYKVFVDGRADELIRGADIVGTPLAALEKIIAAGDDYQVFNGACGRESGWVPNTATAPSLLVQTMEIKRRYHSFQKPPILPEPGTPGDEFLKKDVQQ